jgi:hypothetical protein
MLSYLIHLGYAVMFCGFLARDVLLLRGLLVIAQIQSVIGADLVRKIERGDRRITEA